MDKQRLFALNFSATQEIDRIQQEEKTKLAAAEARIVELENKNTQLETQMQSVLVIKCFRRKLKFITLHFHNEKKFIFKEEEKSREL